MNGHAFLLMPSFSALIQSSPLSITSYVYETGMGQGGL